MPLRNPKIGKSEKKIPEKDNGKSLLHCNQEDNTDIRTVQWADLNLDNLKCNNV